MSSTLSQIESGDLYALLSVCSNADMDPIVRCITGKFWNFLDVDEDYQKFSPLHEKYYRKIGDHIRLYGGNSFKNAWRGEGPDYADIVVDVCEKLGLPNAPAETVANEAILLKFYFEGRWDSLSWERREELIAEIRSKAAEDAVDVGFRDRIMPAAIGKKVAKSWILGGLALAPAILAAEFVVPAAIGAAASRLADPNFKVTAFCVLHLAYLRRRFIENAQRSLDKPPHSIAILLGDESMVNPPQGEPPITIIIGESADRPILSVSEAPKPTKDRRWRKIAASDEGISRLNPLFQAFPSLMTAAEVGGLFGTRYMTVVANGPLAKAAGGGFLGFVRGANGGVASHARLDDPALLASIASPAAIWQIASIVVAQKHLADINEKLDKIKAGIDNINFHLKEDRRSIATGAIRYFSQITNSILAGELSNSVRSQIEAHECALLKMQEQVLADIQRQVHNICHVKLPFAFGSDSSRQAIRECQEELYEIYEQFLLCLKARACGWQLLLAFPGEDTLKESRRRDIGDALVSLNKGSEMLRQTDEFMQQKIRELSSMWNTKLTVNERKMELREWGPKLNSDIEVIRERILEEIRIADMAVIDLQGAVTFVAKVEDGRVVAISPGK